MKLNKKMALQLLAIYLILSGLMGLGLSFPGLDILAAVLALIAGILLLLRA
jgi:hypothetical protein